jgi:pilus assembly protein CpaF
MTTGGTIIATKAAEAFDLLLLLNTLHSGTISSVHANSAHQALNRFTSCVLQSNVELPYRDVKSNIADSLNLLIHIERRPGRRCLSGVLKIVGYTWRMIVMRSTGFVHWEES